jgi:hypothetical protein
MATKHPKQPTDEEAKARAMSRWEGEGGAPAGGRKPKRPRDMNQWAKNMVDLATMDETELAVLRKRLADDKKSAKPKKTHKPGKRASSS